MKSPSKDIKDYLQKKKEIQLSLKTNNLHSVRALASSMAKYFDQTIEKRKIKPDIHGRFVFSMLKTDFFRFMAREGVTKGLRDALKDYQYRLRVRRTEVEITKIT